MGTRSVGLLDEQPLFVRLGRHGHEQPSVPGAADIGRRFPAVRRAAEAQLFLDVGLPFDAAGVRVYELIYVHKICRNEMTLVRNG